MLREPADISLRSDRWRLEWLCLVVIKLYAPSLQLLQHGHSIIQVHRRIISETWIIVVGLNGYLTNHEDAEKRREAVYALYLRGASLNEIASIMDIPRSVAHYDISQTRLKNKSWVADRLGTDGKVYGFYKEMWDRHLHAYREAWRMYELTEDQDVRLKAQLLNQALQCLDRVRAIFARMTPQISDLDWPGPESKQETSELPETPILTEDAHSTDSKQNKLKDDPEDE